MEELKTLIELYKSSNGSTITLMVGVVILGFRAWAVMPNQLKAHMKVFMKKKRTTQLYANAERMKYVVRAIDFNECAKTQLFQKLLFLKIESICEISKKIDSESKDVWTDVTKNIQEIIDDYSHRFTDYCIERHGTKGVEVAEYLLQAFDDYHKKNVNNLLESLTTAQETCILTCNEDIICYYYAFLNSAMQNGVIDCHRAFVSFNGHIQKILNR